MRILNLQAGAFVQAFRDAGHEVLSIGQGQASDVCLQEMISLGKLQSILQSKNFSPDLIFWCDDCRPPEVLGVEHLPSPVIGFTIDQYCNAWHVPFSAGFDCVLVAQKDYLPLFDREDFQRRCEWFPLFCNPSRDRDESLERDIPVSFVGTLDGVFNKERRRFMEAFRSKAPLFVTSGKYPPIYNRSKIVLNQSAAGELNYRLFESMACGAVCLTEDTCNGLRELFTPDEEILVYERGNAAHAAHVALEALQRPDLAELARAGRDKVHKRHSIQRRAGRIVQLAAKLAAEKAAHKRLQRMRRIQVEMRNVWAFLATDETLPLPEAYRRFFLEKTRGNL